MKTARTLFTGFGGADIGMIAAGLEMLPGIEHDAAIAAVAADNGIDAIVADILTVDPRDLEPIFALHASPPCTNFSNAKTQAKESPLDLALAGKVAEFIEVHKPRLFTLENVWKYGSSQSWRNIAASLEDCGYRYDLDHINAANFGVPQTRKRMIVRAVLGDKQIPPLPTPLAKLPLFRQPWKSWYDAIEDLIDDLPADNFAPWQEKLMPKNDHTVFMVDGQANSNGTGITIRSAGEPAFTVSASSHKRPIRAQITAGHVVRLSPRCLTRFQSFPDSYGLPDNKTLACKGVGNAVPPLLMQRIYEQLLMHV